MDLRIFVTSRCDMRCTYCKVRNDGRTIEWPRLRAFLRREADASLRDLTGVHLLGGEPFLAFGPVRSLVRFLREEMSFPGPVTIFTNGLHLDEAKARFLNTHRVKTTVSVDGLPANNDTSRLLRGASGSQFERVMASLSRIDRDGIWIHITLTEDNVSGLSGFLGYLASRGLRDVGLWPADYVLWSTRGIERLARHLGEAVATYENEIRFAGMDRFSTSAPACRAPCQRVYLGPDGKFYLCKFFSVLSPREAARYAVGDLRTGIDQARRERLLGELLGHVRRFEEAAFTSSSDRAALPYVYCPINTLLYAKTQDRRVEEALADYYNLMFAFNTPFLQLIGKGERSHVEDTR